MKKRNIFLGVILAFGLTSCFDMDKMPEGVLSTAQPFSSTGEMRNYLDQFYQTGNPKYEDDKINVLDLCVMKQKLISGEATSNEVYVENTDELKNALKNAKAGDEIILADI